jgi:transcriptional regulator with XRE-family HTH domain
MDLRALADFLRARREALQPEDVGLSRGPRRRAHGLRREELAELSGMSTDYYARLERSGGPQPSEQMVAAIARGLRLSLAERDHLFQLAGHGSPKWTQRSDHINPGLMRVLDRLADTPAQIMNSLGETLAQTPLATTLLGDQTGFEGMRRANIYRWFLEPESRDIYARADHDHLGRVFVAQHRYVFTRYGADSRVGAITQRLLDESPEFEALWASHEVGLPHDEEKHFVHAEVGDLFLNCQTLLDADQEQVLLVFTATPGSASAERLQLLSVIGNQRLSSGLA